MSTRLVSEAIPRHTTPSRKPCLGRCVRTPNPSLHLAFLDTSVPGALPSRRLPRQRRGRDPARGQGPHLHCQHNLKTVAACFLNQKIISSVLIFKIVIVGSFSQKSIYKLTNSKNHQLSNPELKTWISKTIFFSHRIWRRWRRRATSHGRRARSPSCSTTKHSGTSTSSRKVRPWFSCFYFGVYCLCFGKSMDPR